MSFRVVLAVVAVLAVALVDVIFGLSRQSAPVPPTPAVATAPPTVVRPAPPVARPAREAAAPKPKPVDVPVESSNAPVLPNGSNGAPAQTPLAQAPAPPNCNVDACEAAYRSFRASDCTYQPTRGERRLCRKK